MKKSRVKLYEWPDLSETRAFVAKFIQKLKHSETLTLLGGFFASIYNSAVEDSSHEIQSELPILPVSAVSAGAAGGVSGGNSGQDANAFSLLCHGRLVLKNLN